MKVGSRRSSGTSARLVASGIALTIVALAGAGFAPMLAASAQMTDDAPIAASGLADSLAPADSRPSSDHLRTPSGLRVTEEQARGARTPTVIRRRTPAPVRTSVATAPAATAATPAGSGWKTARVSWYGPGFYGNTMAGGGVLRPDSMVVAHRSLAFGTRIEFSYKGRTCIAVVQDRGPFTGGRVFDLGPGTATALGFGGVGTVSYRIL